MKASIFLTLAPLALAAPAFEKRANPTVIAPAPEATVVGKSLLGVDTFDGIPFAKPPVGPLRLKPPQPIDDPLGEIDGTGLATACPQFFFSVDGGAVNGIPTEALGQVLNLPIFQKVLNAGEDCLTIKVQRPVGIKKDAKLPVLFWIFGGGFELGSTSMYDGTSMVAESVKQGKPIIFVAVNYRVGGFGFMPGKKILEDGSANLGLLDQRLGLQWVADNIESFGGDPEKVTIWGESAGALSVLDQMVLYDGDNTYKGKPLFRGAIMNSGTVIPADPVDGTKGEAVYNKVVQEAGCAGAADSLECLREVDYDTFLNAANSVPGILSYHSVSLSYLPRPDGTAFIRSPELSIASGKYAKVPFIAGNQEDEGTLFALFSANITTKSELSTYINEIFFPDTSKSVIDGLIDTYQTISLDGSPFRTLLANNWYPQFKRLAAMIGDLTFTITRRLFLEIVGDDVPSWSYLATYNYGTPVLGTFHGSDLLQVFYGIYPNYAARTIRGYYYSFIYNLDPNGDGRMHWPKWNEGRQLAEFALGRTGLIKDDFRQDTFEYLKENQKEFYI